MTQGHDHHQHAAGHAVEGGSDQDQHRRALDLDAEVFGGQLSDVLDAVGPIAPRRIVDLGAGTGASSRLLRDRFPDASVTAVDNAPPMLDALRAQGFATVEADLDAGFPEVGPVDLVWASSSLHHVADPARLLAGVRTALASGGVLAVVEIDGLPAFTTDPAEDRARAAALAAGWNHHPDWTGVLESAGFTVRRQDVTTHAATHDGAGPAAREYARLWLSRYLDVHGVAAPDRAALTELLAETSAETLVVEPRATRSLWIAEVSR